MERASEAMRPLDSCTSAHGNNGSGDSIPAGEFAVFTPATGYKRFPDYDAALTFAVARVEGGIRLAVVERAHGASWRAVANVKPENIEDYRWELLNRAENASRRRIVTPQVPFAIGGAR